MRTGFRQRVMICLVLATVMGTCVDCCHQHSIANEVAGAMKDEDPVHRQKWLAGGVTTFILLAARVSAIETEYERAEWLLEKE